MPCLLPAFLVQEPTDSDVTILHRCEPWPSALAMSAELLGRPHLVARQQVCELGCGLGLAGLAAAVAGATGLRVSSMS